MKILFVTTFDQQLYEHSGRRLVQSFDEKQTSGRLLCCHEGFGAKLLAQPMGVVERDVTLDQDLLDWDAKFRERCDKSTVYWNKRAWQWYRKIVAINVAQMREVTDVRWLVWLDCDCEFLADISPDFLENLADGAAVTYLKGQREWTETGVVVYDLDAGARFFLREVSHCYESGEFLKLNRWDDCWIFDRIRQNFAHSMFRDIADPKETDLRVLDSSPLGKYILHKKGSHLRAGIR